MEIIQNILKDQPNFSLGFITCYYIAIILFLLFLLLFLLLFDSVEEGRKKEVYLG